MHFVLMTQKHWHKSVLDEAEACLAPCQGGEVALFKCLQRAFCLHCFAELSSRACKAALLSFHLINFTSGNHSAGPYFQYLSSFSALAMSSANFVCLHPKSSVHIESRLLALPLHSI